VPQPILRALTNSGTPATAEAFVRRDKIQPKLAVIVIVAAMLLVSFAAALSIAEADGAKQAGDLRIRLARRIKSSRQK
jgi:hypothetical protein